MERTINCECGCGQQLTTPDPKGRERRFLHGHNGRVEGSAERRRIKVRERASRWYYANHERRRLERLAAAPELRKANRAYYAANRESQVKRVQQYQTENAEHVRQQRSKYRRENRPIMSVREHARRARVMGAAGSHSLAQWLSRAAFHGWRCRYCGTGLTTKTATKDHMIPLIRGGSNWPSNLVPSCASCNSKKNRRTFAEYMERLAA